MSDREFQNYLALLTGLLKLGRGQRDAIERELRGHLEERLEELVEKGMPREDAVRQALMEFGDAAGLAASFVQISRGTQRRWIMRVTSFSVAATLLLAAGLFTFWPGKNAAPGKAEAVAQAPAGGTPQQPVPLRSSKMSEALSRRIDIDFQNVPLKEVADYLTKLTGVTFHLQRKKLEEASISDVTPFTSQFKDIRLKTWLDLALEELELTYMIRDDIVLITTPEHAESRMEVRIYDCRDLLAMPAPIGADKWLPASRRAGLTGGMFSLADDPPAVASAESQGAAKTQPAGRGGGGGFGGGGLGGSIGGYIGDEERQRPLSEHDLRVESLITLITGNIDQDSWDDMGGPGSIHEYNGLIVVTQTGQTHDKVERVLDMLRAAADLAGPGKVVRD